MCGRLPALEISWKFPRSPHKSAKRPNCPTTGQDGKNLRALSHRCLCFCLELIQRRLSKAHFEAFMRGRLPASEISWKFPRSPHKSTKRPSCPTAGRTPKLENGLLRTAPINPGGKTTHGKVPSDLGHLAPQSLNLAHERFVGNFPETSKKLPRRQPHPKT